MITFHNPFEDVLTAACRVKQNIDCIVQFDPRLECPPYGVTAFDDEGKVTVVSIGTRLHIEDALEILAHELAHVIVGIEKKHGKEWNKAFEDVQTNYKKIIEERE